MNELSISKKLIGAFHVKASEVCSVYNLDMRAKSVLRTVDVKFVITYAWIARQTCQHCLCEPVRHPKEAFLVPIVRP